MKKITSILALFITLAVTGTALAEGWNREDGRAREVNQVHPRIVVSHRPVVVPERRVEELRLVRLHHTRRFYHRDEYRHYDNR